MKMLGFCSIFWGGCRCSKILILLLPAFELNSVKCSFSFLISFLYLATKKEKNHVLLSIAMISRLQKVNKKDSILSSKKNDYIFMAHHIQIWFS